MLRPSVRPRQYAHRILSVYRERQSNPPRAYQKKRRIERISVIFSSVTEKSAVRFILSAVPVAISSYDNGLSFAFAEKQAQISCQICSVKSVSTVFRISSAFNPSKGFSFGRAFNDCRVLAPVFMKSEMLRYPSCNCCNI